MRVMEPFKGKDKDKVTDLKDKDKETSQGASTGASGRRSRALQAP